MYEASLECLGKTNADEASGQGLDRTDSALKELHVVGMTAYVPMV